MLLALADLLRLRLPSGSRAVSGCLQLRPAADGAEPLRHVAPGAPPARSAAVIRRTPWHPPFSPQGGKKLAATRSRRPAPTPAALNRRNPFTTFQSQAMSNPYGRRASSCTPATWCAPRPPPFQNAAPWRYLSTGKSQSPTLPTPSPRPPTPSSLPIRCVRSRRGRRGKDDRQRRLRRLHQRRGRRVAQQAAAAKAASAGAGRRRLQRQTQRRGLDGREGLSASAGSSQQGERAGAA